MINEEIDESEFYHQDFTTASEWEIFIARIEEIIHEWKVDSNKGDAELSSNDIWQVRREKLPFSDVEFTLTHYKKRDICCKNINDEDDVKPKHPVDMSYDFVLYDGLNNHPDLCLSKWYGINEFIVLTPANNASIILESRIKILLSSLNIVAANINCETPMFVQIKDCWQKCYLGVCEGNGLRTNFEMVHLHRGPQHCQYLTGLIDLFKTKLISPTSLDPIIVSVQLTYTLSDYESFTTKIDYSTSLPFGVAVDPLENLFLKATWSHIADNLIVDSENYSNFDPMQAQQWSVLVKFTERPVCHLTDYLTEFLHLLTNGSTVYDILGDFVAAPVSDANPLDLLTESKVPTISSVLKRAARNSLSKPRKGMAPLSEDVLVPMLYFMFPDAEEESSTPYSSPSKKDGEEELTFKFDDKYKGFKTCGKESLVWRLAVVLANVHQNYGGSRGLSHLWFEFTQEMRYRWEKSIAIPGLAPGFPDPRTCLLHQKLQMLNCCIERRKARESTIGEKTNESGSSSEEEFFDCNAEKTEEERAKEKHSLWNQPVGRQGKFENMKLLKTGDPLFIPITQDSVPKTEDQLEEDTDLLLKLGSDATGSELRARMMSASLLSDMESFKAANPGSILDDFIRWYSPRDWIEDDGEDEWGQKKGHLSSRMLIENNTWVDTWKSAKPVPANRQKRLFDDTREAEKVLHFLESRTLAHIAEMLLPVLANTAVSRIDEESEKVGKEVHQSADAVQHLLKTAERISRNGQISTRRFEQFLQELESLELLLSQAISLAHKFDPYGEKYDNLNNIIATLLKGKEIEIAKESKAGGRLIQLFGEAQKSSSLLLDQVEISPSTSGFPPASEREFVMRVAAHRPQIYSAKTPQFLRAILTKKEFRLAGAFSEDIVFF